MVVRPGDRAHTNGVGFPKWNREHRSVSLGQERSKVADAQGVSACLESAGIRQLNGEIPCRGYECPIMLVICKRCSGVSPTNSNPELTLEVCRTMATVVTG